MMDMVRKHCVPGTGNYEAAQACVDRTHEMIRMFRDSTRNFVSQDHISSPASCLLDHWHKTDAENAVLQVPPRDSIDRVPLGASSASMYPGYSPADHIYGEAAAEYGAMIAEARRQGKEIKSDPNGIEYVVGQSQLSAREQLEEVKKSFAAKQAERKGETSTNTVQNQENGEPMEGIEQTTHASHLFVVDSNPTPVSVLQNTSDVFSAKGKNKANDKAKRRVSSHEEEPNATADATDDSHRSKKIKVSKVEAGTTEQTPFVEEDDISAEVDKRLAEKEERRRRKVEKKRKRESGSSRVGESVAVDVPTEEMQVEKPETKKLKNHKRIEDASVPELAVSEENKPKEKKKKRASVGDEVVGEKKVVTEGEKPKKKRKKDSKETAV